jgi:hypothetical protein
VVLEGFFRGGEVLAAGGGKRVVTTMDVVVADFRAGGLVPGVEACRKVGWQAGGKDGLGSRSDGDPEAAELVARMAGVEVEGQSGGGAGSKRPGKTDNEFVWPGDFRVR